MSQLPLGILKKRDQYLHEGKSLNLKREMGKQCKICQVIVENENYLKDHMKLARGPKCESCMMRVKNENDLKVHEKLAHRFKCQKCSKICPTFENLIEHHIKVDINRQCGICHKEFKFQSKELVEHVESHRDTKDNSFVCVTCGDKFLHFQEIEIHSLRHNTCLLYTSPSPRDS